MKIDRSWPDMQYGAFVDLFILLPLIAFSLIRVGYFVVTGQ